MNTLLLIIAIFYVLVGLISGGAYLWVFLYEKREKEWKMYTYRLLIGSIVAFLLWPMSIATNFPITWNLWIFDKYDDFFQWTLEEYYDENTVK